VKQRPLSWAQRTASRLEQRLFHNDWPARLSRRLGLQGRLTVREHRVALAGNGTGPPLRIAFGTDFHSGPMTGRELLLEACRTLARTKPDLLLLGGDFVDAWPEQLEWLAPHLGAIPAPLGRFAVLGNHDQWTDPWRVRGRLEDVGIDVLINRSERLPPPFERAWICGIDDRIDGRPDAEAAFAGAEGVRIALMHSPSNLLDIGTRRFDLAFCGHTHGGQIALPGGIAILAPGGALCRKYSRGRFELPSGGTLLVSTGIGLTGLPVRAFADPEILVCDVHGL
jgi:predicted MPP superfamily phosphohydrolase